MGATKLSFDLPKVSISGNKTCEEDPDNCYSAAIVKTTDGGKTWKVVYRNIDEGANVYPNGIHCSSELHCIAALEGESARIVVTRDGGKSWKESMHDPDSASSLVSVHMLSEKEAWVSGGHLVSLDFEGRFWHTLDGGDTWTKEAIKGLYIFSFDMVSAASGYAVALTESSGVQLMKYRHNSSQPTLTTY